MRSERSTVRTWLCAVCRRFRIRGFLGGSLQPGGEHLHGAGLVLQLRALVLAGHDDAGRKVRDSDRGVGGVDALTALAGRAVDVDPQIGLVDLDLLDLFRLRVDEDTGGGRVDASLRFGDRHSLHAVHAALELQLGPHAVRTVTTAI